MRILHIISSSGLYGAENVVLNIINSLKANKFIPHLLCLKSAAKPNPEIYSEAKKYGISADIISCRSKFDINAIKRIKEFIQKNNIMLVHSHNYKSNFYGLIASRQAQIPVVATLHGWTSENNKVRLYEFLDRIVIKNIDHLVAVSPIINDELNKMGLSNGKVTFIPNAVDTEKFNPDNIKEDRCKEFKLEDAFVIGTAGRLNYEKGHIYLIKAFEKIQAIVPKVRLLIIGEGRLEKELKEYAGKNSLANKIVFTGKREDMPLLYKTMDIFVLPSVTEGIPVALLEAMAMKIPVIATDVGGTPYVIASEKDGILVPPKNSDILAEKIHFLIKNKSIGLKMGEKARDKILNKFSLGFFHRSYLKVYEGIIKNAKRLNN